MTDEKEEEEQRLRDRVKSKNAEEHRLKDRIKAKHRSGNHRSSPPSHRSSRSPEDTKRRRRSRSPRGHRRDSYHHRPHPREMERRRDYDRRDYDRRGPPPGYGRPNYPPGRYRGRSPERDHFGRRQPRSYSRSRSRSRSSSSSDSSSSSSSSSSNSSRRSEASDSSAEDMAYNKDQRTVLVSQLIMRTTERDIAKFFRSKHIKTRDIALLRDRHTQKHKGLAYVELKHMSDMSKACSYSGHAPDFQRFPILIKASEAEKNYASGPTQVIAPTKLPPLKDANGQAIYAQKVYVGNLEVTQVTAQHLQALFAPFGQLEEVVLQPGKGYAFLQYHDPKEGALAIQSMKDQVLAGKALKTGWATNPNAVTAEEFPENAKARVEKAYAVLAQLTQSPSTTHIASSTVPTVAQARATMGQTLQPPPKPAPPAASAKEVPATTIGNAANPSNSLIVHNMYDKDKETDPDWQVDIREEFIEECTKYGKIVDCVVCHREAGGKIYVTFASGAQSCASSLAGRWFDKRQLRVEYIDAAAVQAKAREYAR